MFAIHTQLNSIILEQQNHARVEISLFGALLHSYAICLQNGTWFNGVYGYDSIEQAQQMITKGFRSAKLSPFVCRMKNARYVFDGQEYECHKHNRKGHALHGLMYDSQFTLTASQQDQESAWIELSADYAQDDTGYPFHYQLIVRYQLTSQGLSLSTTVRNTDKQPIPIADGWHPYFRLEGQADTWQLRINSDTQLEFDNDLLPTGNTLTDERFIQKRLLSNIQLDNSFVLKNATEAACQLENEHLIFNIFVDDSYPYLQIYIPPERNTIALENLSGAPDCFNNGLGLHILAPNSEKTFQTRYYLREKTHSA